MKNYENGNIHINFNDDDKVVSMTFPTGTNSIDLVDNYKLACKINAFCKNSEKLAEDDITNLKQFEYDIDKEAL